MRMMRLRPWTLTAAVAALGIGVSVAIALFPSLHFAYRDPKLHVVFDTIEALIALAGAYLIYGRLRERKLLSDVLLVSALVLFGFANLFLITVSPDAFGSDARVVSIWGSLVARILGASAIALAALSKPRTVADGWVHGWKIVIAAVGGFGALLVCVWVAAPFLPIGFQADVAPVAGLRLVGHPVLLGAQLVLLGLFVAGATGCTRTAQATGDPFLSWLGPGLMLAAAARLNYFHFPSLYTDYVSVGDFLRLGFYLLLLVGASKEIRSYWSRLEEDIRERDLLNAQLEELALTDPLTGLHNRRGLEALAQQEMRLAARLGHRLALVFIDLDEMKTINDTFGHDAGDQALKDTATVLTRTFRDSDLLCRLGGDEFCAVMVGDASEIEVVVNRLGSNVEEHNAQKARPYRLSLSAGVAPYDKERHASLQMLLEEADRSMYEEKLRGKMSPSLLVVEDDVSIRDLITVQLQDDYQIETADSARAALATITTTHPGLVVLDLSLPDMSGKELIESVRTAVGDRVPIMVLTGGSLLDEADILRWGADDYLTKPFDEDVLRVRIEKAILRSTRR